MLPSWFYFEHIGSIWKIKAAGAAYKPNSVLCSGYPGTGNDHSSMDAGCQAPLATYPGTRTSRPQTLPYLVLHRVGFT
jgi:hypothetical protein